MLGRTRDRRSSATPALWLAVAAVLIVAPYPAQADSPSRHGSDAGSLTDFKAMLLKYVARCALDPSQRLSAPSTGPRTVRTPGDAGTAADAGATAVAPLEFPGLLGLAPEWLSGTCTGDCQERVSSCLISLVNRTGKHVDVSMTSAAASLIARLEPNANDLGYPHQEGAFFGNVWTDQTFACQGAGVRKAPQSKRFCALEPATCFAGNASVVDAGTCADSCEMRCFKIGPNDQRCAAVACRGPDGHVWRHPITVFLRNEIAAVNADRVSEMEIGADGLVPRAVHASAAFNLVDFGAKPGAVSRLRVGLAGTMPGARLDAWLGESRRLGSATVKAGSAPLSRIEIPLTATMPSGTNTVVLRVEGGRPSGRITSIEAR